MNFLSKISNRLWHIWQKMKAKVPRILSNIWFWTKVSFLWTLMVIFGIGLVGAIFMSLKTAYDGIKEEGEKQRVEKTKELSVISCNNIEFRKCIVEGHEYWYASYLGHGGPVHSASCSCHTNKVEVVE